MFILVLSIGSLNAFEFDNIKQYDSKENKITIKNSILGIPFLELDTVAEIKLNTPQVYQVHRGYNKVAEINIRTYEEYKNALQELNFYNIKDSMSLDSRSFDYKYKVVVNKSIPDYIEVCIGQPIIPDTSTNCHLEQKGFHYELVDEWVDLGTLDLGNNVDLTIGIFTEVKKGDQIEWIPKYFGIEINEWATWSESLEVDLLAYWDYNSTTNLEDIFSGSYNLTADNTPVTDVDCSLQSECWDNGGALDEGASSTQSIMGGKQGSMVFWMQPEWSSAPANRNLYRTETSYTYGFLFSSDTNIYTKSGGHEIAQSYDTQIVAGEWKMVVSVWDTDANIGKIYLNDSLLVNDSNARTPSWDDWSQGYSSGIANIMISGNLTEVAFWNRTLTDSEIIDLYDGGSGTFYPPITSTSDANVTLIEPINNTLTTETEILFNCTGESLNGILNLTLLIDDIDLTTITNTTALQNLTLNETRTVTSGYHNWTCRADDEQGTFTAEEFFFNNTNDIEVNLNQPSVDYFNSSLAEVEFDCNANASLGILNLTLLIDGVDNTTILNTTANQNLTLNTNLSFVDNNYNWTCRGEDKSSSTSATTKFFNVDTTAPTITVNLPNSSFNSLDLIQNMTVNITLLDSLSGLDTCYYDYNNTQFDFTCNTESTYEINHSIIYEKNFNNLTVFVNDTLGNELTHDYNWTVKLIVGDLNFNNETTELNIEDYNQTLTIDDSVSITSVNLIYNQTTQGGGIVEVGSDSVITLNNFQVPNVDADINLTAFWSINLNDSTQINLTSFNQSVRDLTIDNCTINTQKIFNFTIFDEELQTNLSDTTLEILFQLFNEDRSVQVINVSNTFTENPTELCLNINLTASSQYFIDSTIRYEATNYANEYYNIFNFSLTNNTAQQNIALYDLNSSDSQQFEITYKDKNFNFVEGGLIQIQRQYLAEGLFKTVEIPKITSEGFAIGHLVPTDVIYNLLILQNGTVLDSFNNVIASCQNPSLQQCEININSLSTKVNVEDFTTQGDFSSTFVYDKDTRTIKSVFTIPSGVTKEVILNATLFDAIGNRSACSDTLTASGGSLSCIVPNSFGNGSVSTSLSSDGVIKRSATINLKNDPKDLYGDNIIFLGLVMLLIMVGIGVTDNPMMLGFMLFGGVVLLIVLNIVFTAGWVGAGATILWLLIALIVVMVKGGNRQ